MFFIHKVIGMMNRHGWATFGLLALLSTTLSTIGFYAGSEDAKFHPVMIAQGLIQAFADLPSDTSLFLVLGKISWLLTLTSAAVSLFLKEWSYKQLVASIQDEKHTVVVGIGKLSQTYLENLDPGKSVIFDTNASPHGKALKERGFAVQEVDLSNINNVLKIENIEKLLINTGSDRDNINLTFQLIKTYQDKKCKDPLRLIVRIENRELNSLFSSNTLLNNKEYKNSKIELKTYSFFEECAVKLFQDNFIDGDDNTVIDSNDAYSIIIAGDGILAQKIVYEAAKIAHLPNENALNIYLVSEDPESVENALIKSFPSIKSIPTLKLHQYPLDYTTLDYFTDALWNMSDLTNAIICYDDENINLEIAASLQVKTYLRHSLMKTKVLFGVFNQGSISDVIADDSLNYQNFIPFGSAKDILTRENIFDDTNNQIAKFVNYAYDGLTENGAYSSKNRLHDKDAIDQAWFRKASFADKHSSLAQAKHITMKLKALGLKAVKVEKEEIGALLENNRKFVDAKFTIDYQGNYPFPSSFNNSLFDNMIRMEHNRWNAYHYLNGWEYESYSNDNKELKNAKKAQRLHNCLMPIDDFRATQFVSDTTKQDAELVKLIEWDIYAFMYLPNYLAEAGYRIESI